MKYSYLLTISAVNNTSYISIERLKEVINLLKANDVKFHCLAYENSGIYKQLHLHAIVEYSGSYQGFTTYGSPESGHTTFKIHWLRIKNTLQYLRSYRYINKEQRLPLRERLIQNYANYHYMFH